MSSSTTTSRSSMFSGGARFRKTKGSNFTYSGNDTYQLVVNNSADARQRQEGGENWVPDPIDTLESNLPPLLEEIRKIRSQAKVREATGIGDSSALSPSMTRSDEAAVAINEIVPSNTSSLPHPTSIADKYTRTMLKCLAGYPLYKPKPYNKPPANYLREGIRVGDVGFIRDNGAFDFLFNICPSQNDSINSPDLPTGFALLESEDSGINDEEEFAHKSRRFYRPVYRTKGFFGCTKYTCSESEGAILELPEGATRFEAIKKLPFKELAIRCGVEWYRYSMSQGRDIANGSLYLVTSSTKCTQWGIAVVEQPCPPREGLRFVHNKCRFCDRTPKYCWKGSSAFITTVAPNPDPHYGNVLNQCVFLRGYKIMLREDIWNGVNDERRRGSLTMSSSSFHQTENTPRQREPSNQDRQPQREIWSSTRPGLRTSEPATDADRHSGEPMNLDSVYMGPPVTQSDEVILHTDFSSSPVHPSNIINAALLNQEPGAMIAITHDDAWCNLLQDIFLNHNHLDLKKIAWSYTSSVDKYGCISFEKAYDSRSSSEVEISSRSQRTGPTTPQELNRQQGRTSDEDHTHILPISQIPPITLVVPEVNENTSPQEMETTALRQRAQRLLTTRVSKDLIHLYPPHMTSARLGGIDESSTSARSIGSIRDVMSTAPQEPTFTQLQDYKINSRLLLHNYVGKHRLGELMYEDHDLPMHGNRHRWTSQVKLNGTTYGQGEGGTISEARDLAAGKALPALVISTGKPVGA